MSTSQLTGLRNGTLSLEDEHHAVREGVGLVDRSAVGRLRITGEDAVDLLDRLSTNQMQGLAPGRGLYTVLTNNKGRVVDLIFVLALDGHLLVLTGPDERTKVAEWIDFYTFTEDVSVEDVTDETGQLALVGPKAAALLEELCGLDVLETYESASVAIAGVEVTVVRTDFLRQPVYEIVLPSDGLDAVREAALGSGHGIAPVGDTTLDLVRIEQGVPVQGRELTEDANPLEAGLIDHISFNKGCYIGQEVVARLDTYDKVQRSLVGLSWGLDAAPEAGADLFAEGKKVGVLTSTSKSNRLDRGIGLGLVRNAHTEPGVVLAAGSPEGPATVVVEGLPFTSERS